MSENNTSTIQDNLALGKKPDAAALARAAMSAVSFAGPIPPPHLLAQYEQVLPGSTDRIIKMAEHQSIHRQTLENKEADFKINSTKESISIFKRGQWFAFILGMTVITGGFILVALGKPVAGSIFAGTGLLTLVSAFLYSAHKSINK